jgi:hypothetical protein
MKYKGAVPFESLGRPVHGFAAAANKIGGSANARYAGIDLRSKPARSTVASPVASAAVPTVTGPVPAAPVNPGWNRGVLTPTAVAMPMALGGPRARQFFSR